MPKRHLRRWATLGDERLLDLRFKDLDAAVEGSALEPLVHQVWGELGQRGLKLRPHVWVSTEWFSPDAVPGIAVPIGVGPSAGEKGMIFYLSFEHPFALAHSKIESGASREPGGEDPD